MLKYSVVSMKNPINQTVKYYARIAPVVPVGLSELSENISRQCTVTIHDVKAVISALEEQIYVHLRNGNSVRLGDLGSFRPTLCSGGSATEKEFSSALIKGVKVRFYPSTKLRYQLSKSHPSVAFQNMNMEPAAPETAPEGSM